MSRNINIPDFPEPIWIKVFSYLDAKSLAVAASTVGEWMRICNSHTVFRRSIEFEQTREKMQRPGYDNTSLVNETMGKWPSQFLLKRLKLRSMQEKEDDDDDDDMPMPVQKNPPCLRMERKRRFSQLVSTSTKKQKFQKSNYRFSKSL